MIYLENVKLLSPEMEAKICEGKLNIYNDYYPLGLFSGKILSDLSFDPVTIFYGGNGSGKTTLLKIISYCVHASRKNVEKTSGIFQTYISFCSSNLINQDECKSIKYISSDDVFDYLLDLRALNSGVNRRKEQLIDEYSKIKYSDFENGANVLDCYEELKDKVDANKMTKSKFIRTKLGNNNTIQESNGETALDFWQKEIEDNSLYIIDEPENSLSAENQIKLKQFIEESARFYNCQFIIATHSPFVLSIKGAKVYDLDEMPVVDKKWTDLKNVRVYNDFFNEHRDEFNK